eukprot:GDKK01061604.1.p1 GENE.GDKK01061604.1~~GDKK01061604.1.p1  ORF type:complete len:516 (+),score=103.87 GDKK01061604.1:100-1647(+)
MTGVVRIDPKEWLESYHMSSISYQLAHRDLHLEYRILRSLSETKSQNKRMAKSSHFNNEKDNRYLSSVPYLDNMVEVPGEAYMNASWISCCDEPRKLIVCQAPMVATSGAFWKMVAHYHIGMIICLSSEEDSRNDESHADYFIPYWPTFNNNNNKNSLNNNNSNNSINAPTNMTPSSSFSPSENPNNSPPHFKHLAPSKNDSPSSHFSQTITVSQNPNNSNNPTSSLADPQPHKVCPSLAISSSPLSSSNNCVPPLPTNDPSNGISVWTDLLKETTEGLLSYRHIRVIMSPQRPPHTPPASPRVFEDIARADLVHQLNQRIAQQQQKEGDMSSTRNTSAGGSNQQANAQSPLSSLKKRTDVCTCLHNEDHSKNDNNNNNHHQNINPNVTNMCSNNMTEHLSTSKVASPSSSSSSSGFASFCSLAPSLACSLLFPNCTCQRSWSSITCCQFAVSNHSFACPLQLHSPCSLSSTFTCNPPATTTSTATNADSEQLPFHQSCSTGSSWQQTGCAGAAT